MKILEIGSGQRAYQSTNPEDEVIHVDRKNIPHVEFIVDLEFQYLPFDDNTFDKVLLRHTLEHIANFRHAMNEVWRVLKVDGIAEIITPYYKDPVAFEPSHARFFNDWSFNCFECGYSMHQEADVCFKIEKIDFFEGEVRFMLSKKPLCENQVKWGQGAT